MICKEDPDIYPLPEPDYIECDPCKAGFVLNEAEDGYMTCQPCPDGTYRSEGDPNTECLICPAGTYALKKLNYTDFNPIPSGFKISCQTFYREECWKS
jgi:hypothetical protein